MIAIPATSPSTTYFACLMATTVAIAATISAWFPLQLSVASVFLFAGPHNWLEARYMLSRLPARWGKLRNFFLFSLLGIVSLTLLFALLPQLEKWLPASLQNNSVLLSTWCSLLIAWIAGLTMIRKKQPPRRNWDFLPASLLAAASLAWLNPQFFSLLLLYAHPLLAFWLLDRELLRSKPHWRPLYHRTIVLLPLFTIALIVSLHNNPPLTVSSLTAERIIAHSGAYWFPNLSSHLLVSLHTFFELTHYGIWILVIPLVNGKVWQRPANAIPLAKRSPLWNRRVLAFFCAGGLVVVLLWLAFLADYATTRDLYFTVAMIHVLAEVPFLLRAL
jgi:hypothetical protein